MKDVLLKRNIQLQPEEKVLLVVRKHWFVLFAAAIKVFLVGILPFVILPFAAPYVSIDPALPTFLVSAWLLIIWLMLFTVWTTFYLDVWIVTDKRIINIDQITLFRRSVSTLRIERVQDIKVERIGFFSTLLNFGELQIQTAGPEASFYTIDGIPAPGDVRNAIMRRVDMTTEHKSKIEYNVEERPSQGE